MNRRGFLTRLAQAAVGATVAYSFPSRIVPKNIEHSLIVFPTMSTGHDYWSIVPRGLPYLINNTGNYFGLARGDVYTLFGTPIAGVSEDTLSALDLSSNSVLFVHKDLAETIRRIDARTQPRPIR